MSESKNILVDFSKPMNVHVVGIGGAGMSAIALVLKGKGHTVSGSDLNESSKLDDLRANGIEVFVGHKATNVGQAQVVTHSTAIPIENPELVYAHSQDLPVLRRAETLAQLTKAWKSLAVAGTHGKTTTSAMLTMALKAAGFDPAHIVGGNIFDVASTADLGQGEYLVVEADESDGTFVELGLFGSIVTNVEPDHLEHYGGFENLKKAFVQFVQQCDGPKILCLDDPGCLELIKVLNEAGSKCITYGVNESADWVLSEVSSDSSGISFSITNTENVYKAFIPQPGLHNALNSVAALAMAAELGADIDKVLTAFKSFAGVGRRYERRGEVNGILLVDDYAHLPTEVEAALAAGRSTNPERLVAVFQPHRYSRTEQLWSSFGSSFKEADLLIVTGIYSSGEKPREGITGQLVADVVSKEDPSSNVIYIEKLDDVASYLESELRNGDLCMTLGAGDLTEIPDKILEVLS